MEDGWVAPPEASRVPATAMLTLPQMLPIPVISISTIEDVHAADEFARSRGKLTFRFSFIIVFLQEYLCYLPCSCTTFVLVIGTAKYWLLSIVRVLPKSFGLAFLHKEV